MDEEYKLQVEDMQLVRQLMGNVVNDINHIAVNSTENSSALRVNPNSTAAQFQNTLKTLVQRPVVVVKEATSYPTPDGGSIPIPTLNNPASSAGLSGAQTTAQVGIRDVGDMQNGAIVKHNYPPTNVQSSEFILAIGKLDATIVELNKTLQNCSFYNAEKNKKKLKRKKHGIRNQSRNSG